jgi:glycosyltransferase involved in cell wall biosynthesis
MDVTVAPHPALDEFYYSPIKLFEYMAAGRAVVASRVGQVAEILVDGETGLLFDPGDSTDLLRCLQQVRTDPTLRQELGKRAKAACSGYTWNRNATQVIDWVEPLLKRIGSPRSSIREEKIGSELSRKRRLEGSGGEGRP